MPITIHIEAESSAAAQLEMEQLLKGLPPRLAGSLVPINQATAEPTPPCAAHDAEQAETEQPEAETPRKRGRPRKHDAAPKPDPKPAPEPVVELADVQAAVKALVEAFPDPDEGTQAAIDMLAEFDVRGARAAYEKGVGAEVIKRAAEITAEAAAEG